MGRDAISYIYGANKVGLWPIGELNHASLFSLILEFQVRFADR